MTHACSSLGRLACVYQLGANVDFAFNMLRCMPSFCFVLLLRSIELAEIETCEGCNHPNDVRVLQVSHDLYFLKITLLIDLVSELLFLQRNGLYCVHLAVAPAFYLTHDSKCATA